ncbi:hypothetical protein THRCLA_01501 [Thraustotheca clavata]|uniref:PWI domain-containing protein n=1 Tax=Thraustotheca clavata TaxID=74557 RepID=A0A1W0A836_9STRA|nr:hypothetical protein THRCLA_01501 [Thraustotheca clavata]
MAMNLEAAVDERLLINKRMQEELEAMEARMLEFLMETEVNPVVEDLSCNCVPEHWLPPSEMEKHLIKCHGIADEKHTSHEFFYDKMHYVKNVKTEKESNESQPKPSIPIEKATNLTSNFLDLENAYFDDNETDVSTMTIDDEVHSLVENDSRKPLDLQTATLSIAPNAVEFYRIVNKWTKIPISFQRLDLSQVNGISQWIDSYFVKHLPPDQIEPDLIDFIIGLLNHADFSQPDMLVAELTEFLESKTSSFVLDLWKFLIVEVARCAIFNDSRSQQELQKAQKEPPKKTSKQETSNTLQEPAIKRRRMSYRAKNVKRNYHQVVRELLKNQMAELAKSDEWQLVEDTTDNESSKKKQIDLQLDKETQRRQREIMQFKDPLEVRNYALGRRSRNKRSRSRSRSNERHSKRRRSRRYRN